MRHYFDKLLESKDINLKESAKEKTFEKKSDYDKIDEMKTNEEKIDTRISDDEKIYEEDSNEKVCCLKIEDIVNTCYDLDVNTSEKSLKFENEQIIVEESKDFNVDGSEDDYILNEKKLTFTCDECNKVFSNNRKLKEHVQFVHKGVFVYWNSKDSFNISGNKLKFTCNVCNKTFIQNCHLEQHVKSIHTGILNTSEKILKIYEKQIIVKESKDDNIMNESKPTFACKECTKLFKSNLELKQHVKSVHRGILISYESRDNKRNQILINYIKVHHSDTSLKTKEKINLQKRLKDWKGKRRKLQKRFKEWKSKRKKVKKKIEGVEEGNSRIEEYRRVSEGNMLYYIVIVPIRLVMFHIDHLTIVYIV